MKGSTTQWYRNLLTLNNESKIRGSPNQEKKDEPHHIINEFIYLYSIYYSNVIVILFEYYWRISIDTVIVFWKSLWAMHTDSNPILKRTTRLNIWMCHYSLFKCMMKLIVAISHFDMVLCLRLFVISLSISTGNYFSVRFYLVLLFSWEPAIFLR